jgi:hypothetical protein
MKTRDGFVSNSSSSSFLIHGASLESDDMVRFLVSKERVTPEDAGDMGVYELAEIMEEFLKGTKLSIHGHDDYWYIGRSYDEIGDAETGGYFRQSVAAEIHKMFPDAKVSACEESWYDG